MRSHLTAFGLGAGLSILAAGAFALIAPKVIRAERDEDGVRIVNIGDGKSGSFHLKDDALNLSAEWKGAFAFAADGRSLSSLERRLEVVSKTGADEYKAVFERKDGAISVRVSRDEEEIAAGADADRRAADLLQLFARSSSVGAEDRVKALAAAGGKTAVLEEIGALTGGHAVGAYIEAAAAEVELNDDDIVGLARRVEGLDSDYAKRKAISALLALPGISDAALDAVIGAAKSIDGDHELRLIVDGVATRGASEKLLSAAAALIGEIDGDHEVRLAVTSLLESEKVNAAGAASALDIAAARIDGDHELRLAIDAASGRVGDAAIAAAALRAIDAIAGAHEKRLAIDSIAGALDGASDDWLQLIAAAGAIDSDHERRLAIEGIGADAPENDAVQAALRKAAEEIGSEHERRLALEAID